MRRPLGKLCLRIILCGVFVSAGMGSWAQDLRDPHRTYRIVDGVLQESHPTRPPAVVDSLSADGAVADGVKVKHQADSAIMATNAKAKADTVKIKKEKVHLLRDSIPISRMLMISAALPGFGQLYNKQAWKIPILYAVGGTSLYFTLQENNKYRNYKREYNRLVYESAPRGVLDVVQSRMIQHNTKKQLFMMAFIGTYIYSLADATLNYRWQSTSVKRATTLSTILPGAGQFYNKSYWKVPIVLGGAATMAFVIDWNNRGYQRFKTAYDLRYTAQQNNTESKDEFVGILDLSGIREWKSNYRRNRDLCIIIAGGLYILNIIEAHVDASLRDYDISDQLAMEIQPRVMNYTSYAMSGNALGFGIDIRF